MDAIRAAGVVDGPHAGVNELLEALRPVDHHVHGVLRGALPRERLVALLTESDRPAASVAGGMDSQLGIAVRRWTAPLLGMERSVPAEEWLTRRAAMANEDAASVLLPAAALGRMLVDTGYHGDELTSPDELGRLAGAGAREVVRLEVVAERLAARLAAGGAAGGFARALRDELASATRHAVGVKSIVAYRFGLDFDPAPPSDAQLTAAAGRWLRAIESGGPVRLDDPVLLRHLLWEGVALGLPLQIHTGYGDTDLDLHRSDPLLLTDFLRRTAGRCEVLLLHTYPFTRQAGYLAQMFEHVSLDVGLAIHHSGAASERIIAQSLEVAPFTKVLFSSDGWGLPELHLLGSWLFRRGMSRVLGRWVADGDWSLGDAARVIELVGDANARRVYSRIATV